MARRRGPRKKKQRTAAEPHPPVARRPAIAPGALPLLALLLAPVLLLTLGFLWNEDLWWYLASGEEILREGGIPEHDPFLAGGGDLRFPAHSWLFTVLTALAHRLLGLPGVALLTALLAVAVTVLVFASSRVDRFGVANGAFTAVMLASVAERLSGKSELASWLFLTIFFYLLDRDRPFSLRTLAALLLLQLLWANLHAGYPLGIAIVLAYTVGGWVRRWWARRRGVEPGLQPPPLWLLPALAAVSLLAPQGLDRLGMLEASAEIAGGGLAGTAMSITIGELRPTFSGADPTAAALYFLALALGGAALLAGRRNPRFLPRACFLAGMAVIAYTAIRHVTGLSLAAALVGLASLGERPERSPRRTGARGRRLHLAAAGALGALLAAASGGLLLLRSDFEVGQSAGRFFTLNPLAACPGAADYLREHDPPGPIFNDQSLGGYLEHRLHPRYRFFVDNRIWNLRRVREYMEISLSPERWQRAVSQHGFRTVVLTNLMVPNSVPLRSHLAADPSWQLAYADPLSAVFVRADVPAPPEHHFAGTTGEDRAGDGDDGGELRVPFLVPEGGPGVWLRRAARIFFRLDVERLLHQHLSVLGRLRRFDVVDRQATRALELRPTDPFLYRDRGSARMLLHRRESGLEDLEAAVLHGADDPWNHYSHALALRDLGQIEAASRAIDRALRLEPGEPRFEQLRRELEARGRPAGQLRPPVRRPR